MPPTPHYHVDLATPADLDHLAAPLAALPLLRRYGATPNGTRAGLRTGLARGDMLLVVRPTNSAESRPCGLAWLMLTPAFGACAYLRLLAVVPEGGQRQGLGAQLLTEAERRCREHANHLFLFTTADNEAAHRFYERHGYRTVGAIPGLVAPGLDELLYHKSLRDYGERIGG